MIQRADGKTGILISVLERPVTGNSGGNIVALDDLLAVKPDLEEARVVVLPLGLDNDLVPLARLDSSNVVEVDKVAVAVSTNVRPVDEAALQLISIDPEHGAGHPLVATIVAAGSVGDELRNVVALVDNLPLIREAEHEAVEALVAAVVTIVVVHLGVVPAVVVGVVRLRHLERRTALVDDVGHLVHGAFVLATDIVPAVKRARVVEEAVCMRLTDQGQSSSEERLDGDHCVLFVILRML